MAQVGRISGPLLTANLERQGKDLDFRNQQASTPLLKLKVGTNRVGINTTSPAFPLDVPNEIRSTNLTSTSMNVGNFTLSGNDINALTGSINIKSDVRSAGIQTQQILMRDNTISTTVTNAELNLLPNGTGTIELQANTNVDGNLHASGNITFDGNLVFGDTGDDSTRLADTVTLNADIHSDIVPDVNNSFDLGANYAKWDQLNFNTIEATNILGNSIFLENGLVQPAARVGNIFYVDKNGSDTNAGDHPNSAFLTLKSALSFVDSSIQGPVSIHISAGEYEEIFPLTVPSNVTIIGEDMRNVVIKPTVATNTNNAFLLDGETTIENITIQDYFSPGYAFAFKSNATVTSRSPYIRNVTVITKGSVTSTSDPRGYDQGDAGKGVLVDGASVTSSSQEASMLFHSVTFITPGVECVKGTNGVRIEWLNSFIYFAQQGILLERGTTGHLSTDGSTIQYGAEMRLIGSANVYGEFGIKADGAGTNAYLVNHNFTYIGTGKSTANDPTLSIHANEVVEINSGRVNYATVDELGNFRVGTALFVDQETGQTEIESATIDFTNVDNLNIVTAGSTVNIDDTRIRTDFIRLRDNKLESLVGNLKIDSALNTVNINANTNITGNLDTSGNTTIAGSLVSLGDADTDNISFNSDVTSGMTPNVDLAFNLGSTSKRWKTAYAEKLETDAFDIEGNRITTKDSNADLVIGANPNPPTVTVGPQFSVRPQEDAPRGLTFNNDGTKMFIAGTQGDDISEYTLSTAFDVSSTVTYVDSLPVINNPTAVKFNLDGTKMYVTGPGTNCLTEYNLSTAFDVSTGVFSQNSPVWRFLVTPSEGDTFGFDFNNDGTKLYVTGNQRDKIYEFDLPGAFDISAITFVQELYVGLIDIEPFGIEWSPDGKRLFIVGTRGNGVDEFELTTPFDISTATHEGFYHIGGNPSGIHISPDGLKMFILGNQNDKVKEYSTNTPYRFVPGVSKIKIGGLVTGQAFTQTDVSTLDSGDVNSDVGVTDNIIVNSDSFLNNVVTPFLQVDGFANLGTTSFVGNRITTNESNADLVLEPAGNGKVKILSDVLVENTIIAPGANYSFASATMEKTSGDRLITNNFNTQQMITGDIVIEGNVISTNVSNSDLDFRASGSGKVILDTNVEVGKSISVNTIGGVAPNINAEDITADFATINTFFTAPSAIVGSISLAGNRIQTIDSNADLELKANGTGKVILDENIVIPNLTVDGDTNITISTAPSATFDNATVTNNIIAPSRITMEGIEILGDKIRTKSSNSNLELGANGTGVVRFKEDTTVSKDFTVNGTLTAHNIGIAGDVDLNELETDGNIEFNDNYVTTTVSNSDLELRTSGGAFIDLQGIKIRDDVVQSNVSTDLNLDPATNLKIDSTDSVVLPKSLTDSTNTFTNNIGAVQYNADINEIVGISNTFKKVLGAGLYSADLQTSVAPRPGNRIEFTAQSINSMTTSYGATTMNRLELNGMDIDGNTISTNTTNSDIILAPEAGQGKVQLEKLHVLDNTFTDTNTDGAFSIGATDNGYVKFNQQNALVIPSGGSQSRPNTPEIGQTRWNVALGYLEIYTANGWTDASGSGATVSAAEMDEIMNEFILIFG